MQHSPSARSPAANPNSVAGAWRLQSIVHDDGKPQAAVEGLIIYDAGGFMSAQIISGGTSGAPEPHSYFGTYSIDAEAAAITHHRIVNNKADAPADVVRLFRFGSDDVLILSPDGQGVELTFHRAVR